MIDLTDSRGCVSVVEEVLRESGDLRNFVAEVAIEIIDLDLIGTQPSH